MLRPLKTHGFYRGGNGVKLMSNKRLMIKQILFSMTFLLSGSIFVAPNVMATPQNLHAAARAKVAQLIELMDRDKNGQVSKEEFLQFMSTEFDRLDADKSGALSRQELSKSVILGGPGKHVGGSSR